MRYSAKGYAKFQVPYEVQNWLDGDAFLGYLICMEVVRESKQMEKETKT